LRDGRPVVVLRLVLADQGRGRPRRRRVRAASRLRARPAAGAAGESRVVDITARLQQLEEMVREAKSMPLSASVLVNREELLEVIADMKASLPEEIKQARWVVKDREELLSKARRDAEAI